MENASVKVLSHHYRSILLKNRTNEILKRDVPMGANIGTMRGKCSRSGSAAVLLVVSDVCLGSRRARIQYLNNRQHRLVRSI